MRPLLTGPKDKRSGVAIAFTMLFCLVLIPVLGLAIDGANVYLTRNQIGTAVNAAVLAGARSFTAAADFSTQSSNAAAIAQATFDANVASLPAQVVLSGVSFIPNQDSTHLQSITGTVSASVPLMLLGMIIPRPTTVNITAKAVRRDVNIILVLDNSGAMQLLDDASNQSFLNVETSDATSLLNLFPGAATIGLVTFGSGASVTDPATPNSQTRIRSDIATVLLNGPETGSWTVTNTSAALETAYQQIQTLNQQGALNVIVLFTGLNPGAFTADFYGSVKSNSPVCSSTQNPLDGVLGVILYQDQSVRGLINPADGQTWATGCHALSANAGLRILTQLPGADLNGNATTGTYASVDLTNPLSYTNTIGASENALDNAAAAIRGDAVLTPVIYVIVPGFDAAYEQGNTLLFDPVLMQRVANDPASPVYNGSLPSGQYLNAPTLAQLQSAFLGISYQVLHLAAN